MALNCSYEDNQDDRSKHHEKMLFSATCGIDWLKFVKGQRCQMLVENIAMAQSCDYRNLMDKVISK